jgi:hypothetical protein
LTIIITYFLIEVVHSKNIFLKYILLQSIYILLLLLALGIITLYFLKVIESDTLISFLTMKLSVNIKSLHNNISFQVNNTWFG